MAFHVVISRSGETLARREFDADSVQIGRDASAELRIDHPTLSRKHAVIEKTGESYTIRDLGSQNGTLVNGRAATGAHALNDGDEIQLGDFALTFHGGAPSAAFVPLVQNQAAYAVFGQTLQVRSGDEHELRERSASVHAHLLVEGTSRTYALDRDVLLLGRGAGCHVRVGRFLGARVAAAIVRGHGGWSLVRLGSRRVSWKGERVKDRVWLAEGDAFAIGGTGFVFKMGLPAADRR